MKIFIKFSFLCLLFPLTVSAQKDVKPLVISYDQAQKLVIDNNLQIIAAQYDVQIAEADLKQARQWKNPLFVWNADLYSLELNQYFNYRNQKLIQIEQVISISGKHRNEVKLARKNVELSKFAVEDVMRGLLYECAIQYTELQSLQEQKKLLDVSVSRMEEILIYADNQFQKGNIAGNEVTRLRTELLDLNTQKQSILSEIESVSTQLRILMALPDYVPIQTVALQRPLSEKISVETLVDLAKSLRPDYQLKKQAIAYEEQNLKLQKSMAVPDFNFGYQPHDKGSNYVRPYSGIVFEMSVPIFDRNQGGIQAAKVKIKQAEVNLQIIDNQIEQELMGSYNKFLINKEGLDRYNASLLSDLESFNKNATDSYNKRLITLLEFIDQQRIYIQTKSQQIDVFNDYMQSVNELNFKVGNKILN
jgi:cobalt-zinc-cadmium efflux system outer membrane protein